MNYTLKETAEKIRMSIFWVREKIHEDKIKSVKMGRNYFVSEEEIERILKEGIE